MRRVGRKVAIPVFRWVARGFRAIQIALWRINYMLVFHLFAFRFGGSFSRRRFRPWTHLSVGRQRPCDFRRAHPAISCLYYTGPLPRMRQPFRARRRVCIIIILIISIHGPPTVRNFLKTAIVQRVASVHHSCQDNFLVQSSCLSGPFFLFGSTIHSISALIPAYPAFLLSGHLSVNRLTSRAFVAPRPGGHLMGGVPAPASPRRARSAGAVGRAVPAAMVLPNRKNGPDKHEDCTRKLS